MWKCTLPLEGRNWKIVWQFSVVYHSGAPIASTTDVSSTSVSCRWRDWDTDSWYTSNIIQFVRRKSQTPSVCYYCLNSAMMLLLYSYLLEVMLFSYWMLLLRMFNMYDMNSITYQRKYNQTVTIDWNLDFPILNRF